MIKFFKQKNNNGGFTLLEVIVALGIFSLGLSALMSVLAQGISSTDYAKNKIIASYLAEEGIEYIRNIRDDYVLYSPSGTGWGLFTSNGLLAPCQTTNGCYFNPDNLYSLPSSMAMTNITFTSCSSPACPNSVLLYDSNTGKYNYTSGNNSGFTRFIQMTIISSDEVKIFSTVSWTQSGISPNPSVSFTEDLFNWTGQ
jgi:prepilin-type N-terminal cleavage/methylation domain-containing protein